MLLALEQRHFQLELPVEMIFDDALVAAGDEDEMLDPGLAGLVDDVLDERPVDHRQHLLRHGLGRRQKAGAEAGDGKNGFADGFSCVAVRGEDGEDDKSRRNAVALFKFLPNFAIQFLA